MASLKTTITEQGLALMNTVIAGSGQLTFTSMAVGDGENLNTSALATDLVNKRIEVEVSKVYASEDGTVVCGNVDNSTVEESFEIREVGVYAKQVDSTDAPILFSYTECEGIGGIPAASIVLVNNEMLITIVTGQAEVLYIENPNATVTRSDVTELKKRLNEDYFSKSDINSGVQTQTIFGYDPITQKDSKNRIYLTGDAVTIASGDNEAAFPKKSGTVALTSDIATPEDLEVEIERAKVAESEKVPLLETVPAEGDNNADLYGYIGTLRNLGAFGGCVLVGKLSVFTRSSGTIANSDVAIYARILKIVNGTWVIVAQSENSAKWGDYGLDAEITFNMKAIAGTTPPSADEKIAIVFVNNVEASASTSNHKLSFRSVSVSGGLTSELSNDVNATSGIVSYAPRIKMRFASLSGVEQVATKQELNNVVVDKNLAQYIQQSDDSDFSRIHGKIIFATSNGDEGGFYAGGSASSRPHWTRWFAHYQWDKIRAYGKNNGVYEDYVLTPKDDGSNAGDKIARMKDISELESRVTELESSSGETGGVDGAILGSIDSSYNCWVPSSPIDIGNSYLLSSLILYGLVEGSAPFEYKFPEKSGTLATVDDIPSSGGFGIDLDNTLTYTPSEEYDETATYAYTYTQRITPEKDGYLSCRATQKNDSNSENIITLKCVPSSNVSVTIHEDRALGYGDMASFFIPVSKGQTLLVLATSNEPATVTVSFTPLLS